MMKKVEVLLSSYNGCGVIGRQITTILEQNDVETHVTIRDDGSTDNTIFEIQNLKKKNPKKISLIKGENIGYRKSFLKAIKEAKEADYYALADQDDIWDANKLQRALECLENINDSIKLYASSIDIYDKNLNYIGRNDISEMPKTVQSFYTRNRIAGCTCVFSEELKRVVEKFADLDMPQYCMPDHDFILGSCAFSCGEVFLDKESFIRHIRYPSSVTSGGNGLLRRIKVEWETVFCRKNVGLNMASLSLAICAEKLHPEARDFFLKIVEYKSSFKNMWKLLCDSNMKSGFLICDIERKVKVLLLNF